MDSNTILSNILQEEVQYFYNCIRDYDEKRIIDIAMVDDVYAKVLEYDMCDVQKEAVMKAGAALNDSNGTVIFAPSRDKTTLVVLSKKVLKKTLTRKQEESYQCIVRFTEEHGFPPTVRELGALLGVASTSTVFSRIRQLEKSGYIRRVPASPRAIEIL